jgi:hypothetical protein
MDSIFESINTELGQQAAECLRRVFADLPGWDVFLGREKKATAREQNDSVGVRTQRGRRRNRFLEAGAAKTRAIPNAIDPSAAIE